MFGSEWNETLERLREVAGGEVLCPMEYAELETRRKRSKSLQVMQPMFLGYVMIEYVGRDNWIAVMQDKGIIDVLRSGDFLLTVAEKDLGGFRKVEDFNFGVPDGVVVEFVGGAFDGHRGVLKEGHVVLSLLGSEMKVPANGQTLLKRG